MAIHIVSVFALPVPVMMNDAGKKSEISIYAVKDTFMPGSNIVKERCVTNSLGRCRNMVPRHGKGEGQNSVGTAHDAAVIKTNLSDEFASCSPDVSRCAFEGSGRVVP